MKFSSLKRIICLTLAMTFVLALTACGNGNNNAASGSASGNATVEPEYEWKLGCTNQDPASNPDLNGFGWGTQKLADLITERSGGRIKVTPYYASVLGNEVQLLDDVRDGVTECAYINPMSGADARLGFKGLPFLFTGFDQIERLLANPDGELFAIDHDILADVGVELICVGTGILRGYANNKCEVRVPTDVAGQTCRIYQDSVVQKFWEGIANPTILPISETYTAIQTGTVDGFEYAATILNAEKYYDILHYYTELQWQYVGEHFIINPEIWNSLPEDLQQIVRDAAWEAMKWESEQEAKDRETAIQSLTEKGMECTTLTDEEFAQWHDYARSLDDTFREYIGADTFDKVMAAVKADTEAHS